jgi:Uncharacterised protein, DegV family COG1307
MAATGSRPSVSTSRDVQASDRRAGVAVVTDTTPYLPRRLVERWRIRQVSLYARWDGDLRPEHEYHDLDAFYTRLSASPKLPATSQPSVGDFVACFEPLVSAGRDVVSIHLASGLSARARARERRPGSSPRAGIRVALSWSTATPVRGLGDPMAPLP